MSQLRGQAGGFIDFDFWNEFPYKCLVVKERRLGATLTLLVHNRWLVALLAVASLFALAACRPQAGDGGDQIVVPTRPEEAATSAETTTPFATSTAMQQIRPTATVGTTPTAGAIGATEEACEHAYFFEPAPGLCPQGGPIASAAAEQPFEGGVMIWLDATDSVIVLTRDQQWQRFEDTWSEEQPESDPSIVPPDGRFQPIRGFGKVWREHPEVREQLGWALGVELGFESKYQEQTTPAGADSVTDAVTFLLTFNDQVLALTTRGADQGDWVIAAS